MWWVLAVLVIVGIIVWLTTKVEEPPPPPVFTCPVCSAEFPTLAELEAHVASEHPLEPVVYTCPHCGATFSTELARTTHILTEHPSNGAIVKVTLKNPPDGAQNWQLIIYDQNELEHISKFGLGITEPAIFTIPAGWVFPLKVDILVYTSGTIYYRMHSIQNIFPEYYREAFIPEYGNYNYNVTTEQFEKV